MKRFSKIASLALLVVAMIFTLAGCKSPKQDVGDIVVTVPVAEIPVAEEAPAAEETPVVEESPIEVVEKEPLVVKLSIYGYDATITVEDGKATFEYPDFITTDEIKAAASAAYEAYSTYLEGTELTILEAGKSVLTFPAGYSQEDLEYAAKVLADAIPSYIMSLVASWETPAVEETKEEVAGSSLYEREFDMFGYTAYILAYENQVAIYYPDFITNAEIRVAAETAYAAYSDYLQGSTLSIDNGFALLTLAYNLNEEDFNFAADLLEKEVTAYVQAMYAQASTEEVEEVEEVAVVAEAPVEEVPATEEETPAVEEEAPVVEETKTEETKTEEPAKQEEKKEEPSTTSTQTSTQTATTTATAEPAKKSSAGVVILIIVLVLVVAAAAYVFLKKKKN